MFKKQYITKNHIENARSTNPSLNYVTAMHWFYIANTLTALYVCLNCYISEIEQTKALFAKKLSL